MQIHHAKLSVCPNETCRWHLPPVLPFMKILSSSLQRVTLVEMLAIFNLFIERKFSELIDEPQLKTNIIAPY